ncbi:MAG: cache domain-containing protein, partial [Proteobacteria bacterium]|nr:cache domain-containing protein [Pseudomonadota bacterium]
MQDVWKRLKPKFLEHSEQTSGTNKSFNFRRLWKQSIVITLAVVLLPLFTLGVIDYTISRNALESELLLRTTRLVSNLRRSLTSYLEERVFALNFIILDNSYAQLADESRLKQILENLKGGLGEWYDLGLIDHTGRQVNYTGPYNILGMDYSGQDWYKKLHYKEIET